MFVSASREKENDDETAYCCCAKPGAGCDHNAARYPVLAVLMLMYSSTFVACCIGRSASYSPFEYSAGIDAA